MRHWNKDRKKGFLTGLLVPTVALATVLCMGAGTMQQINALVGGINIYVDGVLQEPKNANGEAVQPIAWQGTTYLPVRAVAGMLTDKEVTWDQKTSSVYIGKQPMEPSTRLDKLEAYQLFNAEMYTDSKAEFKKLDLVVQPFNRLKVNSWAVYTPRSDYRALTGKLDISYTLLGEKATTGVAFYSVDQYGEEALIDAYFCRAGDNPVDVNVDLTGVEILKIQRLGRNDPDWPYDASVYYEVDAQLYDLVLTAA